MCLIGIRVRPSSTVSCTGMSRIMLMSLPAVGLAPDEKFVNAAGATVSVVCTSVADAAGEDSASAAAHSAAILSSSLISPLLGRAALSGGILGSQPAQVGAGQQLIDLQRVLAVGGAVVAIEDGHAGHLGLDAGLQVELDEVARLEREQLLDGGRRRGELGHD